MEQSYKQNVTHSSAKIISKESPQKDVVFCFHECKHFTRTRQLFLKGLSLVRGGKVVSLDMFKFSGCVHILKAVLINYIYILGIVKNGFNRINHNILVVLIVTQNHIEIFTFLLNYTIKKLEYTLCR